MATIFEFKIPTEEFALEDALMQRPSVTVEIERVVANDPDRITPYVRARADDFELLEAAFDTDPTVENITLLSELDGERSYQMTWAGSVDRIVPLLTDHGGQSLMRLAR